MSKRTKKIVSAVIVILLAILLILPLLQPFYAEAASKNQINEKISGLKSELSGIKSNQADLKKYIADINAEQQTKVELIAQANSEIEMISAELDTVYQLIDEYEILIDEKYAEKSELETKREAQENQLAGILQMSYEYGDDNYLEILFGAKDFGDFLSRVDYLSYFLGSSKDVLNELDATYNDIVETTEIYESSLQSIDEYRASSEELQGTLEEKKSEAEAALALLDEEEEEQLKALEEYEAERRETEREIANLSAELKRQAEEERKKQEEERKKREAANKANSSTGTDTQATAPTSSYSGSFGWPLNGYTKISSGFGSRTNPITYKSEFHNGIDLPAPKGTPILAPADGTVSSSGVKGGYGNCVVLNHGGGVVTLYGHADSLCVSAGQTVKKGDIIARVGTTGQSTGNHLHFTIYEGGTAVNPLSYY